MSNHELLPIWRRCANSNDEHAWQSLEAVLTPVLCGHLRRRARWPQHAGMEIEDVAQEVYCRLVAEDRTVMRSCRAGDDSQLRSFLGTVCRSVASDVVRRRMAHKRRATTLSLEASHHDIEAVADRAPVGEQRLEHHHRRRYLRDLIQDVAAGTQHAGRNSWIAERALLEGWTSREISEHTGMVQSTVDSVISRLRKSLLGGQASRRETTADRGSES